MCFSQALVPQQHRDNICWNREFSVVQERKSGYRRIFQLSVFYLLILVLFIAPHFLPPVFSPVSFLLSLYPPASYYWFPFIPSLDSVFNFFTFLL